MIPDAAVEFVYMYQAIDLDGEDLNLTAEEEKRLILDDGDLCFVSLGGFIYLDANRKPVAANAMLINSVTCRYPKNDEFCIKNDGFCIKNL